MRQLETITVPINRAYAEAYEALAEPRNYPSYSPIPHPHFEPAGNNGLDWSVDLPRGRRILRFAPRNTFGILDYSVLTEAGVLEATVPLRLIPNDEGCVLVGHYFQRPGTSDEQFHSDVEWAANDLKSIGLVIETM